MRSLCSTWFLPVACLLALVPTSARADVFDILPDDALAVVIIHEPTTLSEKVQKLGNSLGMQWPHAMIMAKTFSGVRAGLDENGTIAVAVMPSADGSPKPDVLIFIPVTDYKAFLTPLQPDDAEADISQVTIIGQPAIVTNVEDYAVFAEPGKTALLEALEDADPLGDELEDSREWIDSQDAAFVGTADGIEFALTSMSQGLAVAREQMERNPPPGMEATMMYFDMFETFFDGVRDNVICAGEGVRINDEGVTVSVYAGIDPDSDWWPEEDAGAAGGLSMLGDLPGGPFIAAMGFAGSMESTKEMAAMGFEMFKAMPPAEGGRAITDEDIAQLQKYTDKIYDQMRGGSMIMRPAKAGTGMLSATYGYLECDDSAQYMKDYEEQMQGMSKLTDELKNPMMPGYVIDHAEVGGATALKLTMNMPAPRPDTPPQVREMQAKMMKMFFGSEDGKMTMYFAPAGPTKVVMCYDAAELAERLAKGPPTDKIVNDENVTRTLSMLDKSAGMVGFISGEGLVDAIENTMAAADGAADVDLPPFPAAPPFGFSLGIAPGGYEIRLAAPIDLIKTVGQYGPQLAPVIQGAMRRQMHEQPMRPDQQPGAVPPNQPVPEF